MEERNVVTTYFHIFLMRSVHGFKDLTESILTEDEVRGRYTLRQVKKTQVLTEIRGL